MFGCGVRDLDPTFESYSASNASARSCRPPGGAAFYLFGPEAPPHEGAALAGGAVFHDLSNGIAQQTPLDRVTGGSYLDGVFASVTSAALVGVEACPVRVEAHVGSATKPTFTIVGLPDAAVREARERVRSAMLASGFPFPGGRVTVNLAPARFQIGGC